MADRITPRRWRGFASLRGAVRCGQTGRPQRSAALFRQESGQGPRSGQMVRTIFQAAIDAVFNRDRRKRLLDDEPEGDDHDPDAHPSEESSLVCGMISVPLNHKTPPRGSGQMAEPATVCLSSVYSRLDAIRGATEDACRSILKRGYRCSRPTVDDRLRITFIGAGAPRRGCRACAGAPHTPPCIGRGR